jgi:hypothetical protein
MVRQCSFLSHDTMTSLAHSLNSQSSPVGLKTGGTSRQFTRSLDGRYSFIQPAPRKRKQQKANSVLVSSVAMTLRRNNIGRYELDEAEESRQ